MIDALDSRDNAEAELGFSYASASDVPFEQLSRAAKELRDLRRFRAAYASLAQAFADACRPGKETP